MTLQTDHVISNLRIYPNTDRICNGVGQIVRICEYWCVEYTASRPGCVDVDYCPTFTNEKSARAHEAKLRAKFAVVDE